MVNYTEVRMCRSSSLIRNDGSEEEALTRIASENDCRQIRAPFVPSWPTANRTLSQDIPAAPPGEQALAADDLIRAYLK